MVAFAVSLSLAFLGLSGPPTMRPPTPTPRLAPSLAKAGSALTRAAKVRAQAPPPRPNQPPPVPVQRFTIVNQAGVSPQDLAAVQRAISLQSIQLHMAWGTPVAAFVANGGTPVYIGTGQQALASGGSTAALGGDHYGTSSPVTNRGTHWDGSPYISVSTGNLPMTGWSKALSHEIVESLVNPSAAPTTAGTHTPEVADPVSNHSYNIHGVPVSNFTLPAYWGLPSHPTAAAGQYDQMGLLTAPLPTQPASAPQPAAPAPAAASVAPPSAHSAPVR